MKEKARGIGISIVNRSQSHLNHQKISGDFLLLNNTRRLKFALLLHVQLYYIMI